MCDKRDDREFNWRWLDAIDEADLTLWNERCLSDTTHVLAAIAHVDLFEQIDGADHAALMNLGIVVELSPED